MDAVDGACLYTDGEEILSFGPSVALPFSEKERRVLAAAQGLWPGEDPKLRAAEEVLHHRHMDVLAALPSPDIIGFHGQTLIHAPSEGRTHQLGQAHRLAQESGISVVYDFRTADMAAGGQGAPLAPVFHHALARFTGLKEPVVFLNIGGVANVTWLDPSRGSEDMLAFDTGPGNALLDDWMLRHFGVAQDTDGLTASSGRVLPGFMTDIARKYLAQKPPKSLDRNDFSRFLSFLQQASPQDGAATILALTVEMILEAREHFPADPGRWLVCGGGRHNPVLMAALAARLGLVVCPVEDLGLDGDMLEAQAFGFLAARQIRGLPGSFPGTTGCHTPTVAGRSVRI